MRKLFLLLVLFVILGLTGVEIPGLGKLAEVPTKLLSAFPLEDNPLIASGQTSPAYIPEPMIPLHKPYSELTQAEREIKMNLEQQMIDEIPSDLLILKNGDRREGQIVEETVTEVRFQQDYRGAGSMMTWIARSSISQIAQADEETPDISYRDIRYKMEFPNMGLYKRPPFTVLTEKNFFDVENAVNLLDGLHSQFLIEFQNVIQTKERASGIQLLFFAEEEDFEFYRDKYATNLGYSVGFYSPRKDRLVIYDQQSSEAKAEIVDKVEAIKAGYQKKHNRSRRRQNAAATWSREVKREIGVEVNKGMRRILRHEGAHQLFSTYGVHSAHGAEHLWLIEGLAVYCESPSFGSRPDELLSQIKEGLISFPSLVNFSDRRGFGELGNDKVVNAAYGMSGLITYYLMQPRHRADFFKFIELLQDPDEADRIREIPRFELLSKTVGMTPEQLEKRLVAEFRKSDSRI